MQTETSIQLLIIEASENDAEEYISSLRNSSVSVRGEHAEDGEDAEKILRSKMIDLVLCSTELDEVNLASIAKIIAKYQPECALIAITDEYEQNKLISCLKDGARDMVISDEEEHLKHVVLREFQNVFNFRKLANMQQAFNDTETRCNQLMDSSRDAIAYAIDGMHIRANLVYLEMFGYHSMSDLEGVPMMNMVISEDQPKLKDYFVQLKKSENKNKNKGKKKKKKTLQIPNKLDLTGLKVDESTFDAALEFSAASIEGEACTQIIIRDQTVSKELVEKLKKLSHRDLLTDTYNRQYFINIINEFIDNRSILNNNFEDGVIYLDIDKFGAIKERLGLTESDLILSDSANLLREIIYENNTLSRFSDHTFGILIPARTLEEIMSLAEEIRTRFENHVFEAEDKTVTATVSVGVTIIDKNAKNAQQIMSRADIAVDMIRENGNNVHLHDPIADERAAKVLEKKQVEDIKMAIKNNRLRMVFQPVVSLLGSKGENWEILVRMLDDNDKIMLPEHFLGVAEKYKLVLVIDRWMIKNALSMLAEKRHRQPRTNFFIKLAGASFADETLLPWLSKTLNQLRIPGSHVVFEVSDHIALAHLTITKKFLEGLKTLNCRMALTHFGTGPTPLNSLKHLPDVSIVKMDGSLLRHLGIDTEKQTQVKSFNETLHKMGKQTVATHVEDANSLAVLWQCGIDYIQGNFIQEPLETLSYDFSGE